MDDGDCLAMCGGCMDTEAVARSRGRGLKRGGGRTAMTATATEAARGEDRCEYVRAQTIEEEAIVGDAHDAAGEVE